LQNKCKKIIQDLSNKGIKIYNNNTIQTEFECTFEQSSNCNNNSENFGIVVITENSQIVIDYCEENNLEFTQCPREIRILEDAISIEIKRLKKTKFS